MERIITSMDQHGRMLIPSLVRERFNMHNGEKVIIEIDDNEIKIINADRVIDEMHELFMKNQTDKQKNAVDDFISKKHEEYLIEEGRGHKNVKNSI